MSFLYKNALLKTILIMFSVNAFAEKVPDYPAWEFYKRGLMSLNSIVEHPNGAIFVANGQMIQKFSNGQWLDYVIDDITAVACDSFSRVWVSRFFEAPIVFDDHTLDDSIIDPANGPDSIYGLLCTKDGTIWAGTNTGLLCFKENKWTNYSDNVPKATIRCIDEDRHGKIWAISGIKGVICGTGTEWKKFDTTNSNIPTNHVFDIAVDCTGVLWFASGGQIEPKYARGLLKYDGKDWQQYDTTYDGITTMHFSNVEVDQNGTVWAFSHDGLFKVEGESFHKIPCKGIYRYPNYIEGASEAMIVDKQGRIWIGTRHYGVYVYDPNYADCSQEKALTLSSPTAGAQIKTGDPVSIQWSSTGCIDSVVIEYRIDTQPWQAIDIIANLRGYSWTAPGSPADQYQIRVSDLKTPSVSATSERFAIIEQQQNAAPVITNQPDSIVVQEGEATSWTATVEDADGDDVTISFESVPAWASVEDFTLTLNPQGDSNSDTVLVIADDGNGGRDTLSLRVIVEHPVITVRPRKEDGAFHFSIPDLQIVFRCSLKEVNAIDIVTVSGRLVKTLAVEAGRAVWDGKDSEKQRVRSGVYALRLRHKDGRSIIRKIVVKT